MLSQLTGLFEQAAGFVWGPWFLVPLLLVTGFFLTLRLRGLQFRRLWDAFYLAFVVRRERGAEGDISHFQALFAFSTIIGWSYYGDRSIEYLLGRRAVPVYRLLYVIAAYAGAVRSLHFVWNLSDLLNGLMALPNLVGLILLSGGVARETRAYFRREAGYEVDFG